MSTQRNAKRTDQQRPELLRSDSGEHVIIDGTPYTDVGVAHGDGIEYVDPAAAAITTPFEQAPAAVATIGRPIGLLGLAQTALDALTELGDEYVDLDGAQIVAARLAQFGARGVPGSSLMHPVVDHVLRLTGADQVRLVGDGRALLISKFGITATVELPAAVADFVVEYDGPDLFPYPALYAVPSMVYGQAS